MVRWSRAASRTGAILIAFGAALAAGARLPNAFARPLAGTAGGPGARAPIHLSVAQEKLIGVTFGTVKEENAANPIEATGTIALDERNESFVQLRAPGWIQRVAANQTYAFVRKGDPLFTIYSPGVETAEQSYASSLNEYILLAPNTAPRVKKGAASIVNAAIDRLKYLGVSDGEIQRLSRGGAASGQIEIDAPIDGAIIERHAFPNMYAEPATRLYTIADLSDVWVYAPIFQSELAAVKPGDKVGMSVDTYPGATFEGVVEFIWPAIDPVTRAARVRCAFANPAGQLKLGMFARLVIEAPLGPALIIPESGVLRTGARDIAFVGDRSGNMRPVEVELGPRVDGGFVVKRGLHAGDRIVTSANFLIDSESQSEAAMDDAAADEAQTAAPDAVTMDVETNPALLRRGENTVVVELRDVSGKAIAGADVSVILYMPPMPEMGMAAMRVAASAAANGSGYTATINLPAGGSWRMTVAASKDGRELARTRMNVSVAGPA
jgi:Cu(I)/Ag(I) efflux system membrane fusion protein/cobalt-zinc-cadmium efflux system membrane fusion protein